MGKKQSPFIGRRVPLVDNGVPILYARYTSVDEILADKKRAAPEPDTAAPAENGTAEQPAAKKSKQDNQQQHNAGGNDAEAGAAAEQPLSKKDKKKLKQQQKQQAAADAVADAAAADAAAAAAAAEPDAAAPTAADVPEKQLSKKEKKRLRQQQQQHQANGGSADEQQQQQQLIAAEAKGNAEEAARIRQVLGFTAAANGSTAQPPAAAAAAAPTAAAAAPKASAGGFSFNFSNLSTEQAVAADMEAKLAAITAVDTADKDGFVPRRVFVGGMPYSYSQEQIEEYWTWCGEIEDLDIMTFPDTGRFRGIAFITFKTQEGADAALGCNGEQLDGQTLKVERCKAAAVAKTVRQSFASARNHHHHQQQQQQQPQRGRQQQQQQQQQTPTGGGGDGPARTPGYNVAYVGNIAFEARPEDISALFDACNVTKVRLHTDKDTRKSKGYAHVHFADDAGLEQAIGMSGTQFMGRAIKVSYGQPKKN